MESPPETTKLSFDEQKKKVRSDGILAAICALITAFWFIPFLPFKIIAVIAMFGLVGNGWLFLFHGSTVISMLLQGRPRLLFQIFISIVTPILFSIYFLKDVQSITVEGINVFIFKGWIWVLPPIGIVGYFSWIASKYLDRNHPFRGFIIASTIIFVICFLSRHGGIYNGSDYDAYGYNEIDSIEVLNDEPKEVQTDDTKEKKGLRNLYPFGTQEEHDSHKEDVQGGFYLFLYIRCVAISYIAMFLGMCWNNRLWYGYMRKGF